MAITKWRGDAQAFRQIQRVTVTNVGIADVFKITCNRKTISFTAKETSDSHVYSGLASMLGDNAAIAEFTEITPTTTYNGESGLWLMGPEDGTPFTVTVSKVNGSVPGVEVATVIEGLAGSNCQQTITITATGGTFTLSFKGIATGNLSYIASAATIQTALQGLSSIGAGNVTVADGGATGNERTWIVTFAQDLGFLDQPDLVADGGNLTGNIGGSVWEVIKGSPTKNSLFQIKYTASPNTPQGIRLTFTNPLTGATATKGVPLGALNASMHVAIQNTLQSMPNIGAGNVRVTLVDLRPNSNIGSYGHVYQVEFTGVFAGINLTYTDPNIGVTGALSAFMYNTETGQGIGASGDLVTQTQQGANTTVNERQAITFDYLPSGGTWTLTFKSQTTAALAYNISAVDLQTALEALSNIGVGDVDVISTTTPSGVIVWTVSYTGALAAKDQPDLLIDTSGLTGGPAVVVQIQQGGEGDNEVKLITFINAPTGGTFKLSFDGQTTSNIAYNATASTIQAALEALSSIGVGNVGVTGNIGGPFTVIFIGDLRGTNVGTLSGDGTNLTASGTETASLIDVVSPTGPNWFNEPNNWSNAVIPASGDTIIFENSDVDCLYGIVPSSVPQSMTIRFDASYTGNVGLPELNTLGYVEYRDKRLRIGDTSGSVSLSVGQGDGDGSSRIRMATGAATTTIDVWRTDQADDDATRAFDWTGTHASNVLRVHDGQVAIAPYANETAAVATLTGTSNADILAGPGAILTAVTTAGDLLTRAPLQTSLTITDGTCTSFGSLNGATVTVTGGTWDAHNSGTATTVTVGPGDIDCSDDYTAKTFTTFTVKANANVSDPNKIITATNLVRGTDVQEIITR